MAAPDENSPLPDLAQSMIEAIARFMDADRGNWTIELTLEDGKLSRFRRHHGPAGARGLAQFAET